MLGRLWISLYHEIVVILGAGPAGLSVCRETFTKRLCKNREGSIPFGTKVIVRVTVGKLQISVKRIHTGEKPCQIRKQRPWTRWRY